MKKSFYDFMNDYEPESTDLKECDVNIDSVKKKVMNKAGILTAKKEYHITKRAFAVLAAVSITATAGIAAAAYETGILSKAVNFFENHTYSESSQILNENDFTVINSNLKEENTAMESNGASVELIGSMHDENVIYLFCRMTLPESVTLEENESYTFNQIVFERPDITGKNGFQGIEVYFADDEIPDDNILDFTCIVEVGGDIDIDELNGIILRDLRISSNETISGINGPRLKTKSVLNGHWYIPLEYKSEAPVKELINEPLNIKITNDSGSVDSITLNSLTVSSLSMKIVAAADNGCELPSSFQEYTSIIMKDGTSYDVYSPISIIGNPKENTEMIMFGKPIDVSQINYIKIDDTKIKVE